MERLTKHIALVLVSSSLVLHGCARPRDGERDKDAPQPTGSGTSTYHSTSHPSGFVHGVYPAGGSRLGTTGVSAHGVSARGGFGGAAHGGGGA